MSLYAASSRTDRLNRSAISPHVSPKRTTYVARGETVGVGATGTGVGGDVAVGAGVFVGARVEMAVRVGALVGAIPMAAGSCSSTARAPSAGPPMTMTTPITPQVRPRITPRMSRPTGGRGSPSAGTGARPSADGALSPMTG